MGKLTPARRDLLERAVRHPSGNPWPTISVSQRGGGAKDRCFRAMQAEGLFGKDSVITPAGRTALSQREGE